MMILAVIPAQIAITQLTLEPPGSTLLGGVDGLLSAAMLRVSTAD